MKKSVLASLLALATIFPGSVSMVYGQGAQSGQITIKDPTEYNDYTNAVGAATPAAKAAAIETFLTKYPNSVVKNDMLEQLMADLSGGRRHGQDPQTPQIRLLAVDPGNLRALFIEVYLRRIPGGYQKSTTAPAEAPAHSTSKAALPRPRPVSALPSRLECLGCRLIRS